MFRHRSFAVTALLLGVLAAGPAGAQEIRRGTLKKLDIENRTVVVTIGGTDHELTLTEDTQVPGGQERSFAEKFRAFREGSGVEFKALAREGRQIVQGIRPVEPARELQPHAPSGDGLQRARVKKVDIPGRTITLTVGEKDVVLALTDQTKIRSSRSETIAEALKGFEPGTDVMFFAVDRSGRNVLVRIMKVSAVKVGGGDRPVAPDHATPRPLDELGAGKYRGYVAGLYQNSQNSRPRGHEAAGRKRAALVQPLDSEGRPDPAGSIVLLSVGMSNTEQEFHTFQRALSGYGGKNPALVLVNGAQSMMTAARIQNPDDEGSGAQYWTEIDARLKNAGVTRAQVQAIWIKQANAGPREGFPDYARKLQSDLTRIVQIFPSRFPNANLVYLSSRTFGGFATTPLNPEPYAYESGFSVTWLIDEQINGKSDVNFDATKGPVKSPWLSWGPYLWANGQTPRSTDGLTWEPADFREDGTHPSETGQRKVGMLLLDFFSNDPTTKGWFSRQSADNFSAEEKARNRRPQNRITVPTRGRQPVPPALRDRATPARAAP